MATEKKTAPDQRTNGEYRIKPEEWGLTKDSSASQSLVALSTRSAMTATTYRSFATCGDKLEVSDLVAEMRKAGDEVVAGDLGRVERMLANQAMTLDAIFNNMAQRSARQESFKGIEVLMRLALKAQAQARSSAEALALLKNPQPYIRQANIAHGPQQVNNSAQGAQRRSGASSCAESFGSEPNKLLEADHGSYLDNRAPTAASRADHLLHTT